MSDVPAELQIEILLRMPAESLFRFRAVCKSWLRIIDDPSFVRSHTTTTTNKYLVFSTADGGTFYSLPLDSLNYINGQQTVHARRLLHPGVPWMPMCNGLLLVSHPESYKMWTIWNPLNHTLHQLPQLAPETKDTTTRCLVGAGIGYDSDSDDYKVVRIDRIHNQDGAIAMYRTLIYSLKSNSWKRTKDCPHHDLRTIKEALYFKGALHWISFSSIVALDMATEEFWQLPLPLPLSQMKPVCVTFDALGEFLVMTVDASAWVMRGYGGENPTWEELFSSEERSVISGLLGLIPLAYDDTQRRLILHNGNTILRWDIEKRAVKRVTIDGLQNCHDVMYCRVVPGSLFRFKSGPVGPAAGPDQQREREVRQVKD